VRLDAGIDDAVTNARRAHVSWEQIGAELGMSRQAAWERWSRLDAPHR
jgi:biotin operon repressor